MQLHQDSYNKTRSLALLCAFRTSIVQNGGNTHTEDSRVVGHLRRLNFRFLLLLGNADILHITAPKDDVFVDGCRRRQLFARVASASLRAVRDDILKCNSRRFGINLMQCTDVAVNSLIHNERKEWRWSGFVWLSYRISLFEIKLNR
jgi:hypothetical protein